MHDFTDEELEITELPEREEMLKLDLGPSSAGIHLDLPLNVLGIIKL
ncbi:MAG TPA: hypothetical protein VHL53_22150 [Acidimicrobiia bacterium]|nr:hypothetical protein [Acidimicrobiia bacterium]